MKDNRLFVHWRLLFFLLFSLFLGACSRQNDDKISEVSQLNNQQYKLGSETGIAAMTVLQEKFPLSEQVHLMDIASGIPALKSGKIHAIVYDRAPLEYIILSNPDLILLPDDLAEGHISVGAPFKNQALMDQVNLFIYEYRKDGTYQEMYKRWINTKNPIMPNIPEPKNPDGSIVIGIAVDNQPMSFLGEGKSLQGFDVEFAKRLALLLNKKCEFLILDYDALFPATQSGKVDLAISSMDATQERRQSMLFSDPYIDCPIAVMVRKNFLAVPKIQKITDLEGKKCGSLSGTTTDRQTEKHVQNVHFYYYNDYSTAVQALLGEKVDAIIGDEPNLKQLLIEFPQLYMGDIFEKDYYGFAFKKGDPLAKKVSETILRMKKEGKIQALKEKWFDKDKSKRVPEIYETPGKNGVLRFGCDPSLGIVLCCSGPNGSTVGIDIDIMGQIAHDLDMKLEIVSMSFGSLLNALQAGKVNAVGTGMSITEERKQSVDFAESYYEGGVSFLTTKPNTNIENRTPLLTSLKTSFYRTFVVEKRYQLILSGLNVTMIISVAFIFFGTLFGFVICLMRRSSHWYWNRPARIYISVIQGTPMLVFLMFLYYVVFQSVEIDGIYVAILGFSLSFAAYSSEIMRSGINSIDAGQWEAASALGFGKVQTFKEIILPQTIRVILPVYRGELISTVKMTSIVGYIAIQDLTKMSDLIRSRTYEAFFPLIVTAVIYFLIAWLMTRALSKIEFRLDPLKRKRILKGVIEQ